MYTTEQLTEGSCLPLGDSMNGESGWIWMLNAYFLCVFVSFFFLRDLNCLWLLIFLGKNSLKRKIFECAESQVSALAHKLY